MSNLLNKRLMRSLWRTKLRLFAIFMVSVKCFLTGITFGGYSHNLDGMYSTMQADDDNGANLADIWIDNRSTVWSPNQVSTFCSELVTSLGEQGGIVDSCEGRTVLPGAMFVQGNDGEEIISSLWHGIPPNANADRVWMPTGYSEGNVAIDSDEIVIDAHVTDALGLSIGDLVKIGAGISTHEFEID